ncbi:hypothetical protein C3B59_04015 [Cryobacterium zongtaii]|uniref:DUF3137 domain-containing protein n=1 Tax=Cryobacterium zongtaii TaxID=1259217 RepID=A0A2S3ZNS6_9MICO|nr:hypothetical protein [Cryobacterium zongtaii]POH70841.1 hypothetical protein C3B59_04015 [Cryobacterium zongtaii]
MRTIDSTTSLHTAALTDRVKRGNVRKFYRTFATRYPSVRNPLMLMRRVCMFIGTGCVPIGALALAYGITEVVSEGAPVADVVAPVVVGALLLSVGIMMARFFVRTFKRRDTPKRHYRLARFATANGLSYLPGPVSGKHLKPWASRGVLTLTRVMRPASERAIEFANYELRVDTLGSSNAQFGGFCAVRLSTPLPHILLRAQAGKAGKFALAALPDSAQRLSLEGDFDDHFTLYCPEEYERDALYLFTPDVMARLIDRVRGFDVEIIDDWLLLVSSRDVVTLDPESWQGLYDAVGALSDKIGRWERWRDDRLPAVPRVATGPDAGAVAVGLKPAASAGRVARRGRRLRMRLGAGERIGLIALGLLLVGGVVSLFYSP